MNVSENSSEPFHLDFIRAPLHLLIIYCLAYGLVFVTGLVGNVFVVMSVICHPSMRNITNYFITSLAAADLLIIIFCLPATLMNNILTEWHMGNFLCKVSVWVNGTTVCTSVYTLVAVTADRYFAICHTFAYKRFDKKYAFLAIWPIWLISGLLFTPWFMYFHELHYPINGIYAKLCFAGFPSPAFAKLLFLIVNFLIAFLVPLLAICVFYGYILTVIYNHKQTAVDHKAAERESRIRVRVTQMMLTVVILFAFSWLPLYSLYMYFNFWRMADTYFDVIATTILKPMFQWLSLANSCVNPILYAYFSLKFRQAFHQLLVLPCRRRYQSVRQFTIRKWTASEGDHTHSNLGLLSGHSSPSPRRRARKQRVKFASTSTFMDSENDVNTLSPHWRDNDTQISSMVSSPSELDESEMMNVHVEPTQNGDTQVHFVKIHQVSQV